MNRRISKLMAANAATAMANAAFDSQIELAKNRVRVVVEELASKYIPNAVRAVCAEFPSYFEKVKYASITTSQTYADGSVGHVDYVSSDISFQLPRGSQYINVSPDEYREVKKLYMRVDAIVAGKDDFGKQVCDALCALSTERKVKESLPEALPYIKFPEEVQLPAPIFGTLRNIIKNIKTDGNGEK